MGNIGNLGQRVRSSRIMTGLALTVLAVALCGCAGPVSQEPQPPEDPKKAACAREGGWWAAEGSVCMNDY